MRNDKLMLQLMTKQGLVTHQVGEANFGHLNICLAGSPRQIGQAVRGESLSSRPAQASPAQTSLHVEQAGQSSPLPLIQ